MPNAFLLLAYIWMNQLNFIISMTDTRFTRSKQKNNYILVFGFSWMLNGEASGRYLAYWILTNQIMGNFIWQRAVIFINDRSGPDTALESRKRSQHWSNAYARLNCLLSKIFIDVHKQGRLYRPNSQKQRQSIVQQKTEHMSPFILHATWCS